MGEKRRVEVLSQPGIWFAMAHIAKELGVLTPIERRALFQAGTYRKNSWQLTRKQYELLLHSALSLARHLTEVATALSSSIPNDKEPIECLDVISEPNPSESRSLEVTAADFDDLELSMDDLPEEFEQLAEVNRNEFKLAMPTTIHGVCHRCGRSWSWNGFANYITQRCPQCGARPRAAWYLDQSGVQRLRLRQ